jgi:CheY-like chemotaxis protein
VTAAKALLVDDRRENQVALEAILQGLPVETVAVGSGEAALKQLLLDDFAVILLDADMPVMDGFETAGHIKRRERSRNVPIIFLTALNGDARLATRGYQLGAADFLVKPFDPVALRSKVSVFVGLWNKNAELATRAEERAALHTAVGKALALLTTTPSDHVAATAVLHETYSRVRRDR